MKTSENPLQTIIMTRLSGDMSFRITMAVLCLFIALSARALHAELAGVFAQDAKAGETIGHGDGRIHVIPSLSRPSLKNGEKLTISAVIKAQTYCYQLQAKPT